MKNIFEQLTDLLKKDERLVSQDGVLLKNQTQELAHKNDSSLIKLLLSDKAIKQHFFFEVEETLIFDKEKFVRFVSNRQFLPESYTAFKNKIGLTTGDEYVSENKEVVLVWPYKDCVLEGGMTKEDQKRDEIFYNETLAPDDINRLLDAKVFTNFKRIDKNGEHKLDGFNRDEKGTIKDNLIIKGNNLLALASLKKEFAGKVKLIYIDPPYNTGVDSFAYNDHFNHSSWLTFMKNRLELAQQLLKPDGLIIIQIDEDEGHYLKVLCDTIFDRENFRNEIIWSYRTGGASKTTTLPKKHDVLLCYAKSDSFLFTPKYERQYLEKSFMGSKQDETGRYYVDTLMRDVIEGVIISPQKDGTLTEYNVRPVLNLSSERVEKFQSQKPEGLIRLLIDITANNEDDIVLDFHVGSGTTAATAHKMGRQYIGVEQLDYGKNDSVVRLKNVIKGNQAGISKTINWQGGGDFVYMELAKWNEEWIQKIEKAKVGKKLAKLWDEMKETAFLSYKVDPKTIDANVKDFADLSIANQKKFLIECLDKNQLYVNLSEIEDKEYGVSKGDKALNKNFYNGK